MIPPSIGIDFGGTSVKMGVCRGPEVLAKAEPIVTGDFDRADSLIDKMHENVRVFSQQYPDISAIGAGLPGHVNFSTGLVHALTNVQGWEGMNLRDRLHEMTGLPCIVENDANAMTYAEWRYGAGKGQDYMLAMTLGTGVGGGIVLGGELYRGASFGAGEIGQVTIDYRGRLGGHGNAGALERYVGNGPFADHAFKVYAEHGADRSLTDCAPDKVAAAANSGDPHAIKIWDDIAEQLSFGLASVLWVLNLDCVVVGGGMAKAGDLLFKPLRKHLETQMGASILGDLKIVHAAFENEAGIIGASSLAVDHG